MEHIFTTVMLSAPDTMERMFDLDFQLLHDAVLTAIAVFCLFLVMSYLLFNPTRDLLKRRQEKIQGDLDSAKQDKEDALSMKEQYEEKIKTADKEADEILAVARKKAVTNEEMIIGEAKEEAANIVKQARAEAELEKQKAKDEVKNQIIDVASIMAGKVVAANIDTTVQDSLVEETLKEVGESTWQS